MLLQPVLFFPFEVVVQAGFADGDDTGSPGEGVQLFPVRPLFKNGSGGMDAHGREYPSGVVFGDLSHPLTGLQVDARLDGAGDIGVLQLPEQLLPVAFGQGIAISGAGQVTEVLRIGVVGVMGVGVNDHCAHLLSAL